jgi:lipopolysaccharide export system protein LptC
MNYRKASMGLAILVAALGLTVWNMRPEKSQQFNPVLHSDYRLHDFQMIAFNTQGQKMLSLSSPLLERDPEGKSLTIRQPVFTFPGAGNDIWFAYAESAWVSDKAREIQLRQQVKMIGPTSPKGLHTEFHADKLSVYPKENRLHSDAWVTISHGKTILKGLGLEANLQQHRVQLLAKVQAHYAPNR